MKVTYHKINSAIAIESLGKSCLPIPGAFEDAPADNHESDQFEGGLWKGIRQFYADIQMKRSNPGSP
jgi:hypothetical protein